VHKTYSAFLERIQSAEIISLISHCWRELSAR